jgi:mersacidin/lichenicidin family type 2 lantibiotic
MFLDTVQAWKNPAYRNALAPAQCASLPANPAGKSNLVEALLAKEQDESSMHSVCGTVPVDCCMPY